MKNFVIKCIKNFLFDYEHPKYRRFIYDLSKQYVNFYQGDQNSNMNTNGEYRFLMKFFKVYDPKIFFDVGANQGDYAQFIFKHVLDASNIQIHCFEPDVSVFQKLSNVMKGQSNVLLNNIAVSDTSGEKIIYVNKEAPELNSFYDTEERGFTISQISVRTITLDQYSGEHAIQNIDLLKVDVEGHELSVFSGARKLIENQSIKFIQFEFGNAAIYSRTFFRDLYDFFTTYGYTIYKIMPLSLERVDYGPEYEKSTYANFVAVKKGVDISLLN